MVPSPIAALTGRERSSSMLVVNLIVMVVELSELGEVTMNPLRSHAGKLARDVVSGVS